MLITPGKILAKIDGPDDLKKLDQAQLVQLCEELRHFIIDNVSVYGGHFGASLGVVELTVALHYVFNTPTDQIVWDVGHQAYGHKILTGRRDNFYTNRVYKGLSGFPKRKESEYDTFVVCHAGPNSWMQQPFPMLPILKWRSDQHQKCHTHFRCVLENRSSLCICGW